MIKFAGYFLIVLLIGITLAIGASVAVSIIGKVSLLNVILLLAVIHIVSYLLLRGDYRKNFDNVIRLGVVAMLFQLIFLGWAVIIKMVGIRTYALLTAVAIVATYKIARGKTLDRVLEKIRPARISEGDSRN